MNVRGKDAVDVLEGDPVARDPVPATLIVASPVAAVATGGTSRAPLSSVTNLAAWP